MTGRVIRKAFVPLLFLVYLFRTLHSGLKDVSITSLTHSVPDKSSSLKDTPPKSHPNQEPLSPPILIQTVSVDAGNVTHLSIDHRSGGWGNRVFQGLHALVVHRPDLPPGPCLGGTQGAMFGSFLCKVDLCPESTPKEKYTHLGGVANRDAWERIFREVSAPNPKVLPFLELDQTAVQEVIGTELMGELNRTCAVHVRFGDHYFRSDKPRYAGDSRIAACKGKTVQQCFGHVADWVKRACSSSHTVYVASDVPEFSEFVVKASPDLKVFHATQVRTSVHMNDMDSFSLSDPHARGIVIDWLALALSKERHAISRSTFSSSAGLGFYLSNSSCEKGAETSILLGGAAAEVVKRDGSSNICRSNPYVSKLEDSLETITERMDAWLEPLAYENTMIQAKTNPQWRRNWGPFNAHAEMAKCHPAHRRCVGGPCFDDLSKITCGLSALEPGCVVYSIGGNNQWQFELSVLEDTPCAVHTFDCTGPKRRFVPPKHDRLHFHHVCVGTEHEPPPTAPCEGQVKCGATWTLREMKENLGHDHVDLWKMDIEGFEWGILESWPELDEERGDVALPQQLLVEIHYVTQFPALYKNGSSKFKDPEDSVKLQRHLLQMGYAVVERDDNGRCKHCTELTLVRVRC